MALTARGDEEALRLLVERWQTPVLRFLERMLGEREEARDLAQETFVRLYRAAPRYRPRERFRSWLFRIAGNLARGRLRRRKVLRWVPFDPFRHDPADGAGRADERLEREASRAAVRDALGGLPERQREAILLRRYGGLSYREIAETLGTTLPGVESLIQRGMEGLRRELSRRGVEP